MTKQIFDAIILRLPDEAFTQRGDYLSLKVSREECQKLTMEKWNAILTDYWNYRVTLKSEGRKRELGLLHEEIDRLYDSMKRGKNPEALRKFLSKAQITKILKDSKIRSSSREDGSEGWSWLALAGLYVHYNIKKPNDQKIREEIIDKISKGVRNLLEGDSGLAKEVLDEVEGLGKCLLNRLIERKYHAKEVFFTPKSARMYCNEAGNYVNGELVSLRCKPEEPPYGRNAFNTIFQCFFGIFRKVFSNKWEEWNLTAGVDQYFLDVMYNNWLQIPENNKDKKDSEWSPYFIVKGEKYIPEKVRKEIAEKIDEHISYIQSGLEWIRLKLFSLFDSGLIEQKLPIMALRDYIDESYNNNEIYRCFPGQCSRCKKDLNPVLNSCPFCGKKFH